MGLRDEILELMIGKTTALLKKDEGSITGDTKFVEDLKVDSLDLVKIIATIEDEFDIEINFMEFKRRQTLLDAAIYVASLF